MEKLKITDEIAEFLVWVIEITAAGFFAGDKTSAYNALKESGLWDIYVTHYDTSHALSREYLLEEMGEFFAERGVKTVC